MKILITGANGFLGYHLSSLLLQKGHTVIATGKGECRLLFSGGNHFIYKTLDFTHPGKVQSLFAAYHPEVVVHAGAMSKPDECELQQELSHVINVKGTEHLLNASAGCNSFFIFLSTDFIFSGEKGMYREEDEPGPVNYYGQTKLEAEGLVKQYTQDWSIVRTVLVYGPNHSGRKNILGVVKEKLEHALPYNVVDDQLRTPTYVGDLAAGIAAIIEKRAGGVFHVSGEESLTPYEMACRTAKQLGLDPSLLSSVNASTFTEPARRPQLTGFIIDKAKKVLGYSPISFEEGLRRTFPDQK